ncbi:MAG: DUF1016 domain-containing protein [Bacteroides sp.]|nr:DUF1016 domain-containing protein [Bacteroides sp.]
MAKEKAIIHIPKEFVSDVRRIIDNGRRQAFSAASAISLATYWNIGRRIVEEEQKGNVRAEYGSRLIAGLAGDLRDEYGPSYNKRNLEHFRKFYLLFNDFQIVNDLVHNLTWTHIRRLLSVTSPEARLWYMPQASKDMWSTTTLDRNICSQYYERRLAEQRKRPGEMLPIAKAPFNDSDPSEYIKNPTVAEFMGFKRDSGFSESELEQALIDNLEKFILDHHKND